MKNNKYDEIQPEILGISWMPGELILVGSRPLCGKTRYVLGNCIVNGVKGDLPVAYFMPGGDIARVSRILYEMTLGKDGIAKSSYSPENIPEYKLFFDTTPRLSISYLIARIFHMVESYDVRLVVIDYIQKVDGSIFSPYTKEQEMRSILSLLKCLAVSLGIVVIVTSQLSENLLCAYDKPTPKDILYVPNAEELCDQIVLIHPVAVSSLHAYNCILPKGSSFFGSKYGEMIIPVEKDWDSGIFKKAEHLFQEEEVLPNETPVYQWYRDTKYDSWFFEFPDSTGMGWTIEIEPAEDSEDDIFNIAAHSWSGDQVTLVEKVCCEDIEKLRCLALNKAREHFPEVEIPEKG